MHAEVFDDMINRFDPCHIALMLNLVSFEKRVRFHPLQILFGFPQCGLATQRRRSTPELALRNRLPFSELRRAVPHIRDASERNDDPLPDIAVQVQQ